MAHAKTTKRLARFMDQLGKGYRTRYVASVDLIVAEARTNMTPQNHALADAIKNETITKAIFVAPCKCEVVRVFVNAGSYPTITAGTGTIKASKAAIGASDVDLSATIDINNPTDETAIDGVLVAGVQELLEGQLVYVTLAISNHTVAALSAGLVACIEWFPKEK